MTTITPAAVSFKTILVASDWSDVSLNALSYAKAIAKRFGSHIVLVHVGDPLNPIVVGEGAWSEDDSTTRMEQQVEAAGIALRAEGFSAEAVNSYGDVRGEIQALAKNHDADLIVLGTHGRRGLNRLFLGSEAEGVIHISDRPVLTVGPSIGLATTEAWAPKNILCATTLSPAAAKVAAYGYMLAQATSASFSLLSVEHPQHLSDEKDWRSFENAIAAALPEERAKVRIHQLLSGTEPAAEIVDFAETSKSDLIVMRARTPILASTHFSGGLLAHVLIGAPCPVLTINTH